MNTGSFLALVITAILITDAAAQQIVYPAKSQSPAQQKTDEAACYSRAVEQSMFDPANPPERPATLRADLAQQRCATYLNL